MRYLCTIVFIFSCIFLSGQSLPTYSQKDSTFTFSFQQSLKVAKRLEFSDKLQREVDILKESLGHQSLAMQKLELRDTLMQMELKKSYEIEKVLNDRLRVSDEIIGNYKALVFSAEEQLKSEQKKTKDQEIWKNVYKYGYPALIGVVTFFILK
jgi:hypothetical protein